MSYLLRRRLLLLLHEELLVLGADLLGAAALLLGRVVAGQVERGRRARLARRAWRGRRGLAVLQLHLLGAASLLLERHLGAVLQDDGVPGLGLHRQSVSGRALMQYF